MAINQFLSRSAFISFAVTSALAGCSSIEPSSSPTAQLTPTESSPAADTTASTELATAETSTAVTKTRRVAVAVPDTGSAVTAQNSAMASREMAPQIAYATTSTSSTTTATAAIQTVALSPERSESPADPETAALNEDALTPDMHALQAAIPVPRPDLNALARGSGTRETMGMQDTGTQSQFPPAPGDPLPETAKASPPELTRLIKRYAGLYGVPESLIHRVVHRESRYNPKAYHKDGYWGLMQIKYATAKSMGYSGPPEGLLDAETNIKYATKYLRGAWLVADNSNDNAIRLYARGYYYDAKRKGMLYVLKP